MGITEVPTQEERIQPYACIPPSTVALLQTLGVQSIEIIISVAIIIHSTNIWERQQGPESLIPLWGCLVPFWCPLPFVLSFGSNNNSGGENNISDNNHSGS